MSNSEPLQALQRGPSVPLRLAQPGTVYTNITDVLPSCPGEQGFHHFYLGLEGPEGKAYAQVNAKQLATYCATREGIALMDGAWLSVPGADDPAGWSKIVAAAMRHPNKETEQAIDALYKERRRWEDSLG